MSSSRTPPQSPSRRGRGVQVRTVIRNTSGSPSQSGRGNGRGSSSRSRSQPSARYRQALKKQAPNFGGDFVKDDEIARQFANRVVEIYAPSTNTGTESIRQLPLNMQARRDGSSFKLPTLGKMCLNIITESFGSHILPVRFNLKDNTIANGAMKEIGSTSSRGLLGIEVGGYDEENDKDFVPDSDEESRRPTKKAKTQPKRIARKSDTPANKRNAEFDESRKERDMELLRLLPAPIAVALQEQLERKAPQLLNYDVMTHLFLSSEVVSRSKLFRVLAIVKGISERDMIKVWQELIYENPLLPSNTIKRAIPDNAVSTLRTLHLQAFTRLKTDQILNLFKHTRNLENVCLRGCVNIYPEAVAKLVETCGQTLRKVNFNWTSIGLTGVEHLIRDAPNLEVLKIAHVKGLSDSSVKAMMTRVVTNAEGMVPLRKLERLKLHGTEIGIQGLGALLQHCGKQIKSLDIGSTRVGGTGSIELLLMLLGYEERKTQKSDLLVDYASPGNLTLEKINLSHLSIPVVSAMQFVESVARCKRLRKVNLDHLSILPSSTMYPRLVEALFQAVALRALERQVHKDYQPDQDYVMDSISFACPSSLSTPIHQVNLRQICNPPDPAECTAERPINDKVIRSLNLSGMIFRTIPPEKGRLWLVDYMERNFSKLPGYGAVLKHIICCTFDVQHLNLSGCRLPEPCEWPLFGVSGGLRSMNLSNSHIDSESVDNLVQNNPYLERIELTGCRSIPITKRRNYF
ncbi:uncharacterized protein FA14DRAFT_171140 [Meira miltonrushii]|uniref:RNI-like protein n=1 Tax=Meira miltonrushii TaxID=1280837 RepID=A0A316VN02_9BASI|nr:uncharacterized protein FA14DRAFT_171140 [Meira miltonrushii]PWN38448.1 hypothetical protein FA14DRAFT_171140 [Meira miltonrushii]